MKTFWNIFIPMGFLLSIGVLTIMLVLVLQDCASSLSIKENLIGASVIMGFILLVSHFGLAVYAVLTFQPWKKAML